jgi:hypothetical protein
MRVQNAGFRAVYWPELRVTHWVPTSRMRARYSMSWFYWSGITHATLEEGTGVPKYYLKRIALSCARSVLAALRGRSAGAMDSAIDVAFVAGYVAHRWGVA